MKLFEICDKLNQEHPFNKLKLIYREDLKLSDGSSEDCIVGMAMIDKGSDGYSIRAIDNNSYSLDQEITKYKFKEESFDGLMVWA